MNRRTPLLAILAATFSIASYAQSTTATSQKKHKLVMQVSDADPAKWNLALNNAKNVQEELTAAQVDIEIVAYGPGIGMLKLESVVNSRVAEAAKAGISIVACENTIRNLKISKEDINPAATYSASGVVQLMRRQSEGWAYVRP